MNLLQTGIKMYKSSNNIEKASPSDYQKILKDLFDINITLPRLENMSGKELMDMIIRGG